MGADFMFAIAPKPVYADMMPVNDFDDIRDEVFQRIINSEDIQESIAIRFFEKEDEDEMTVEDWLSFLDQVRDYFRIITSVPRDCGFFSFPTEPDYSIREYVVTGGCSWGDDPTDSFEAVYFADCTGIFDKPFAL